LEDYERRFIEQTLEATAWRIGGMNGAAQRLGLNRTTLISKMRKLGISRREQQQSIA
jgi:DNA-binding NtrC family response regulator